jgi:AAA15 family ATPase/GTPase
MITRVKVRYFKQFLDQEFELSDHIILSGPNNSGKTTLQSRQESA